MTKNTRQLKRVITSHYSGLHTNTGLRAGEGQACPKFNPNPQEPTNDLSQGCPKGEIGMIVGTGKCICKSYP